MTIILLVYNNHTYRNQFCVSFISKYIMSDNVRSTHGYPKAPKTLGSNIPIKSFCIFVFIICCIFLYLVLPLNDVLQDDEKEYLGSLSMWGNRILNECNFSEVQLNIRYGKKNVVKRKRSGTHIYITPQKTDEAQKKLLISLLAYTTTDSLRDDTQYHTNLERMLCTVDEKIVKAVIS